MQAQLEISGTRSTGIPELFPITHGALFFPGMEVLPTSAVYGTAHITASGVAAAEDSWRLRVQRLFEDAPIAFRPQNGGDYPDGHVLGSHVAIGQSGLAAHIAYTSPGEKSARDVETPSIAEDLGV
jgi:NAD(P)H dehydrogenase (quinone)